MGFAAHRRNRLTVSRRRYSVLRSWTVRLRLTVKLRIRRSAKGPFVNIAHISGLAHSD